MKLATVALAGATLVGCSSAKQILQHGHNNTDASTTTVASHSDHVRQHTDSGKAGLRIQPRENDIACRIMGADGQVTTTVCPSQNSTSMTATATKFVTVTKTTTAMATTTVKPPAPACSEHEDPCDDDNHDDHHHHHHHDKKPKCCRPKGHGGKGGKAPPQHPPKYYEPLYDEDGVLVKRPKDATPRDGALDLWSEKGFAGHRAIYGRTLNKCDTLETLTHEHMGFGQSAHLRKKGSCCQLFAARGCNGEFMMLAGDAPSLAPYDFADKVKSVRCMTADRCHDFYHNEEWRHHG